MYENTQAAMPGKNSGKSKRAIGHLWARLGKAFRAGKD